MNAVTTLPPPRVENIDAEFVVLGGMMTDNRSIDRIADKLTADDFAEALHGRIFSAIVTESARGREANPVTLQPYLKDDPALMELGGNSYLFKMTEQTGILLGLDTCADQVRDMAKRRRLIEGLNEAAAMAADMAISNEDVISVADGAISSATEMQADGVVQMSASDAFREMLMEYEEPKGAGVRCVTIKAFDEAIGPIRPHDLVIAAGRPGMGKAQPLDAKVLTPVGWKAMGDLVIGDELASLDGAPSFVSGVFPQGLKQLYRVTFSDGRSTEACAEHLWKVRYRTWPEDRVLSTATLIQMLSRKRYVGRLSIDMFDGQFGMDEGLLIDPWLLGALLGDGRFGATCVGISSPDAEILDRVRATVPEGVRVQHAAGVDYRLSTKYGEANPLLNAVRAYGLGNKTSPEKFIPPPYMNGARETRLEVLRGLIDTDGWVEKSGTMRFASSSRVLAEQVQYLVRSLGGLCDITTRQPFFTYKGERKPGLLSYMCKIRHAHSGELVTLLKKQERTIRTKNATVQLNIRSIEPSRTAAAQCISVSHPSRLYVTDDFIVTHNTIFALTYAIRAAQAGHGVLFVSREMKRVDLMQRAAADLCFNGRWGVAYDDICEGTFKNEEDRTHVYGVLRTMRDLPLAIIDAGHMAIGRLNMIVRRQKRRFAAKGHKLELVVVDYLQLLSPDRPSDNETANVSAVSVGLKGIAKTHDLGVLSLAQLNRGVDSRENKRPLLSDLRQSGQIEQDADAVIFLYREEYYLRKAMPPETDPQHASMQAALDEVTGKIELITAKRRKGEERTTYAAFWGKFQTIRDE